MPAFQGSGGVGSTVESSEITDGTIVNADVNASAGIVASKLSGVTTPTSTDTLTNKTIDADGTGNSITNIENADIKASAGIDATKLADGSVSSTELQYINSLSSNAQTQIDTKITTSSTDTLTNKTFNADGTGNSISNIENADIKASAGIVLSKLATDPLARANHTGTQAFSTVTGTVPETQGGTNQTTYTQGDVLYASASNTLSKLGAGVSGQYLKTQGAGANPTWSTVSVNDTPWTVVHDFDTYYFDMEAQVAPANPSADNGRVYVKQIDANNDGIFIKIKKAGGFVEVQIA